MKTPNYDWVCQKCGHTNKSGTGQCEACGFGAYFTVKQLDVASANKTVSLGIVDGLSIAFVTVHIALYFMYSSDLPKWMQMWLDPRLLLFGADIVLITVIFVLATLWEYIVKVIRKNDS
jgi:ribosomal protein L37E